MSTDRELLELAAKAAGYDITHPWNAERLTLDPPVIGLCIPGVSTLWNPLTDDGDALRLAVKLELDIYRCRNTVQVGFAPTGKSTRRAIVRAAAEIGRTQRHGGDV